MARERDEFFFPKKTVLVNIPPIFMHYRGKLPAQQTVQTISRPDFKYFIKF